MLSYALFNFNKDITCKRQNHSFLTNKFSSHALYQTLQTTKMNFEKNVGQTSFQKPTISIHFNRLQVCPSLP